MKKPYNYAAILLALIIFALLFYNYQSVNDNENIASENNYTLKVLDKENFWIYEVYNNENLFIRQEFIPAVKNGQVFSSKEDAEKIGKIVIGKLSKNKFPVISISDLEYNNIEFKRL